MNEQQMIDINNFVMPQANPGMQILWYRNGYKDRTSVEVAYMLTCGMRTAVIHASSGRRVDAVRHIDDPKLKLNHDQRESGAWDFTDDHKAANAFREETSKRIAALEDQVCKLMESFQGQPEKKATPKKRVSTQGLPSHLKEFHDLRARAKALGIELGRGLNLGEIRSLVESKENSQPQAAGVEAS